MALEGGVPGISVGDAQHFLDGLGIVEHAKHKMRNVRP
jgi:hypothetical protein